MDLQLERAGDYPHVHHVEEQAIAVIQGEQGQRLTQSFILTENAIIPDWPVSHAEALTVAHLEPILALKPEVVILGTGTRQIFPSAEIMKTFIRRGIGIEPMDNKAAARTHTIMTGEQRQHIATAFILGN